ncbi:MAG TPA: gliding motility-associated ABC transporter substrate-binding protein GldG [Bacteroidales bacterium]|jgi:gliding-associated putative ABC transporter substrate-binding component GldG|nr:gliding motility-associated ABC transporter substrate-binding protein GldG [Bacteroidales bacterium]HOU98900.1 gliding motility-associated ABC transporter substrate-binding protein GldG [Bacteroidales bacterium]
MERINHSRKSYKRQVYRDLLILITSIVLINYIASFFFTRIDLTAEKRYTLTNTTKTILTNLKDVVYVKVYLEGDMPYGFKRLNKSIKETLDEFRSYAGDNIQYEFINPSENPDKKTQKELFKQLYNKGLTPTNVQEKDDEGKISEKVLFPGALISYGGREIAVDFLHNSMNLSPEENLNASVEDVEFSMMNAIRKLKNDFGQRIAFIEGHGESAPEEVEDFTRSLTEYFEVERVRLDSQIYSLSSRTLDSNKKVTVVNKYDLAIIANPDSMFSEFDKYIIDQFIMYGGKVIWLIDAVDANMDSLAYASTVMATIKNLNLNDQLFKYGARVNPNLVQDMQCAIIPVNTAISGTQPQFTPSPWVYFPLLMPNTKHPIGKNVNLVKGQFVSSVDPVGDDSTITKTVLLTTSQNSRAINAPLQINLGLIKKKLNPDFFTKSYIPTALLLEGRFNSIYLNRLAPEMYEHQEIAFKEKSYFTQLAIIGDGDIIRNHVKRLGLKSEALPLGYDRYTGETFGNKEFLMNLVSYMLDNKNFTELHSKVVQLRLLDRTAIEENKSMIQLINVALPAFLILAFGLLLSWYRKQKFSKNK